MKQFKIFKHPQGLYAVVKQGISWPAFFFWAFWAAVKGLWKVVVISLISWLLISLGIFFIGAHWNLQPSLVDLIIFTFSLSLWLYFGANGNKWREKKLIERGFDETAKISSTNPEKAYAEFLKNELAKGSNQSKSVTNDNSSIGIVIVSALTLAFMAIPFIYSQRLSNKIQSSDESTPLSQNDNQYALNQDLETKFNQTQESGLLIDSISPIIEAERISEIPIAPAINISEGNGWPEDCAAKKTKNAQASAAEAKGWLVRDAISAGSYTFVLVYSQAEAIHKDGCWIKNGALLVFRNGIPGAIITVKDGYDYLTSIGAIQIQNETGLVNLRLHPGVSGAPPYADMILSEKNIQIKEIPDTKYICAQKIKTPNVYRHTDDDARMALTNYGWREEKPGPDESDLFCDTNNHCYISFTHQSGAGLTIDLADDVVNVTYMCDGDSKEKIY